MEVEWRIFEKTIDGAVDPPREVGCRCGTVTNPPQRTEGLGHDSANCGQDALPSGRFFGETFCRLEQACPALRVRGVLRDRGAGQRASQRDRTGVGGEDRVDQDGGAAVAQSGPTGIARASGRGGPARRQRPDRRAHASGSGPLGYRQALRPEDGIPGPGSRRQHGRARPLRQAQEAIGCAR